jgi:hypothetical protein
MVVLLSMGGGFFPDGGAPGLRRILSLEKFYQWKVKEKVRLWGFFEDG